MKRMALLGTVVLTSFLFAVGAGVAIAQTGQIFGELLGKVVDNQGAVLPGVTVTLTSPALMGTRTATTNDTGLYRFPGVNPGTYTLTFELEGFSRYIREGIIVAARTTVTIDGAMSMAALSETVTVTGASPTVDLDNTTIGARLDAAVLATVPQPKSIWGTATLAPGVVLSTQDPGGLNATPRMRMIAHGSNSYQMNYFGVTADTPQNYGSMYYLDMDATDELSVETASMGADLGGGGGAVINVLPKSGSNQFDVRANYAIIDKAFIGDNRTPELLKLGIPDLALEDLRDFHVSVGGPIKTDKVWYFGSMQEYRTVENVPRFPLKGKRGLRNITGRVTSQAGSTGQLGILYLYDKRIVHNNGGGPLTPDPITTIEQRSPKNLYVVNYTNVINANNFIEVALSHFDLKNPSGGSKEWEALTDAQRALLYPTLNLTTGINTGARGGGTTLDSDRTQGNIAWTRYQDGWLGASHQIKTGFENWYGRGGTGYDIWNGTQLLYQNNASGVAQPVQIRAHRGPLRQKNAVTTVSAFVQDRIKFSRVTVNAGLRFNRYKGMIREQTGGGNQWFPRVTYDEIDPGFAWTTLAPRTGLIWKMTDDSKNVFKTSYSRYFEVLYTAVFDPINPNFYNAATGVATYRWFGDINNNGLIDTAEYDPNPVSVFKPQDNSIDPNIKNPKVDEITFGVERELTQNIGVSAVWLRRWFTDNYANVNVGIPPNAYTPRTFNDAGPDNLANTADDQPITLYDVSAAFLGKDAFLLQTVPGTVDYQSVELQLNKRMSNRWQMMASYAWSRNDGILMGQSSQNPTATGQAREFGDPTNPNNLVNGSREGRQGVIDQPHSFKVVGSVQAPLGITIGTIYQALSGLTLDRVFRATLTQGSVAVLAEPRGTYRADFMNLLSLNASRSFRTSGGQAVSVDVQFHNVLNTSASQEAIGTQTQAFANQAAFDAAQAGNTTYFGRRTTIFAPFFVKFLFKVDF